jgi:hypothetical protein
MEAKIEDEHVARQQHKWVNQAPQPTGGRANVSLLKIAFNQLCYQCPALDQIAREVGSRNSFGQAGSLTAKRVDLQA